MNITNIDDLNNPTPEITEGVRQWEIAVFNNISGRFLADNHLKLELDQKQGNMLFKDSNLDKHNFCIDLTSFMPFIQAINGIFTYEQSVKAGVNFCYEKVTEWLKKNP